MKLKKIRVMKSLPEISNQEIDTMMDFDKVLDAHRNARRKDRLWISAVLIGTGVIVGLIAWKFYRSPEPSKQAVLQYSKDSTSKVTPLLVEPAADANENPPVVEKQRSGEESKEPVVESTQAYTEAEPVSGFPTLYDYFHRELTYPVEAIKDSIEGIVSVSFVINKEGKPEQIKILSSLGAPFDNEAVRVIAGMPQWKPASMNGKPVPARISMPLTFRIERTQRQ